MGQMLMIRAAKQTSMSFMVSYFGSKNKLVWLEQASLADTSYMLPKVASVTSIGPAVKQSTPLNDSQAYTNHMLLL